MILLSLISSWISSQGASNSVNFSQQTVSWFPAASTASSPVLPLNTASEQSTFQAVPSQLHQECPISVCARLTNSAQSSRTSPPSPTCQSSQMPTPASAKERCVLAQLVTFSTPEPQAYTSRIKFSPSAAATSMEKNWFPLSKWSIKSKSPGKPQSRCQMDSSSSVLAPTQRECMDWRNASIDQRPTSMQEQTWSSLRVWTQLRSSRLLRNSWKITKRAYIFLPTWLSLEKPPTLTSTPSNNMATIALSTQFPHFESPWKPSTISSQISSKTAVKKASSIRCKVERNFTIFLDTLLVKSGTILRTSARNDSYSKKPSV